MSQGLQGASDLIGAAWDRTSAAGVGRAFFERLRPFGVRAIFARAYSIKNAVAEDEHVYSRISPPGWESLYAERRFQNANFLNRELGRRAGAFAWSEIARLTPAEWELSNALAENGFEDGLAIPCHGPMGYAGVVSLAFERLRQVSPEERVAIQIASLVLHERMRALANPRALARDPKLSPRELDCLAFIAEGRSDGEIATILGVSLTTVVTHVQNARRKLGARTRAQAVAGCLRMGLI